MINGIKKLILVFAFWSLSLMLSATLFEVYFFNLGMPLQDIYLVNCLWFTLSLIIVPFLKGFKTKDFMLMGIALAMIATLVLILLPVIEAAYIFRFIISGIYLFFWIPFNIIYYEHRKGNNATIGAIYYSVAPMLSLAIPAIAGFIASYFSFSTLYMVAIVSFLITAYLVYRYIENKRFTYDLKNSLKNLSGLRSLMFMEGFSVNVLLWTTLPITLLIFVDRPLNYGIIMSLLTIFTVLATLFTGKMSDKFKKRREFILPTVLLLALSVIFASQASDIVIFFVAFALINFFSGIFFPLPLALALDNTKSLPDTMIGRELLLNVGRIAGTVLGLLIFIYTDIQTVILVQGMFILIYIPIFEMKKKKLEIY